MCFTNKLVVKKSTIPGAGKGLFTRVDIPKGSLICEYAGTIVKNKERKFNNDYVLYLGKGLSIDAMRTKHIGRFANDARGFTKMPGGNNSYYYSFGGCMAYIIAARRILSGEEIFVRYGAAYWKVKRVNGHKV